MSTEINFLAEIFDAQSVIFSAMKIVSCSQGRQADNSKWRPGRPPPSARPAEGLLDRGVGVGAEGAPVLAVGEDLLRAADRLEVTAAAQRGQPRRGRVA